MNIKKIINLLDNTPNKSVKFRTKNWFEINDDSHGTYNTNTQIKFKTSILNLSLCDYRDTDIYVKGTITVPNTGTEADPNNRSEEIFNICVPFTDCISKIIHK